MKLVCEICGGTLEMKSGGKGAACTVCGLTYSLDYLKEMLEHSDKDTPAGDRDIPAGDRDIPAGKREIPANKSSIQGRLVTGKGLPKLVQPQQFIMELEKRTEKKLFRTREYFFGNVIQGGMGNGDKFFVNYNEGTENVFSGGFFEEYQSCVKTGDYGMIDSSLSVLFKACNARTITGERCPKVSAYNYRGNVKDYFAAVMLQEFPEYSLYKDVQEDDDRLPADYMLCRNDCPVAVIYLADSHDNSRTRAAKRAIKAYAAEGVAGVHFYDDYRNDLEYVKNRIADAMYAW